tara:strand:- start:25 stop:789 length:765 start_codon:yes stop_codon:yes gene_type:complete
MQNLKGRNIAIVALGGSSSDYVRSRIVSNKYDEVWGINCIGAILHVDRTFMMDPASRFLDDIKAGKQTGIAKEFLLETPNKGPIYSCCLDERVPEIVEYPLYDVITKTDIAYFNNTVSYALGYAVAAEVGKVNIFGVDFSYKENIHFAEAGRACVEFWCAFAISKGIRIDVAPTSGLLDANVPEDEKLYGYHRLEDPLVQRVQNGQLIIAKKSKVEEAVEDTSLDPPEPLDNKEPVLIGRHDVPNISYKEEKSA